MNDKIYLLVLVIINSEDVATIAIRADANIISDDFLLHFKEPEFAGISNKLLPIEYRGCSIAFIDTIDDIYICG